MQRTRRQWGWPIPEFLRVVRRAQYGRIAFKREQLIAIALSDESETTFADCFLERFQGYVELSAGGAPSTRQP